LNWRLSDAQKSKRDSHRASLCNDIGRLPNNGRLYR
jgi:hypothetical protein